MGSSQSTNRAAKFSGSRTNTRICTNAPSTAPMMRRQLSQRNTNRNVKEFSKFWSNGGSFRPRSNRTNRRSESLRRSNSVRRNRVEFAEHSRKFTEAVHLPESFAPAYSPQSLNYNETPSLRRLPENRSYTTLTTYYRNGNNEATFDSKNAKEFVMDDLDRRYGTQFLHETAIY